MADSNPDSESDSASDADADAADSRDALVPPEQPMQVPEYVREGVARQSPDRLRAISEWAAQLADYKEAKAEREREERLADADVVQEDPLVPPDEWDGDDEEWDERVREASDEADVAPGGGSVVVKHIPSGGGGEKRPYLYLNYWNAEKRQVDSEYIAPVNPAGSGE